MRRSIPDTQSSRSASRANLTCQALIRLLVLALALLAVPAFAEEPPLFAPLVASGKLPPMAERLPKTPLVADMIERGRTIGHYGGDIRTLVSKAGDLKYITVMGYTRLVGYDQYLNLEPDILQAVQDDGDRIFTFTLREGHRWSDGQPFTTEDFRFYWEDVANNRELNPAGPPDFLLVNEKPPKVEVLDATHIRYSWDAPNPRFLPHLAEPRPDWIYAPAHYLKQFHKKYGDMAALTKMAKDRQMDSWATLYNRLDDPYGASNPDMPTLDPWHIVTRAPSQQFIFERNPYFHRVDPKGQQLPYVDRIVANVASLSLFATKANAGEVDLQYRGLITSDIPTLKEGEAYHDYRTLGWPIAKGSAFALYPDLTAKDKVWRKVLQDVRVRRALSLGIDRHALNNALWFRLGIEGNNTVMPSSALYSEDDRKRWADFNPALANQLLDDAGLGMRDASQTRMLPDGRPMELVVEVDGGSTDLVDALQLVTEFWQDLGIKLVIKPEDLTNLRKRAYSGQPTMVASEGLDNAVPTALMPPTELAPVQQANMAWPKWGQYAETMGASGEKPELPEAQQLMDLYWQWMKATTLNEKTQVWRKMLALNADQQFVIGTVQGALQPIVVAKTLQNIPRKAVYSWEPTANLGAYRVDEFYYEQKTAQAGSPP